MDVIFVYDEEKDVDCLLSKGGGSNNRPGSRTSSYNSLLAYTSDISNRDTVREFIRKFISENKLNPSREASVIQSSWTSIRYEFERRADRVFGIHIHDTFTAYLTVTGRFPYSVEKKYFYVPAEKTKAISTTLHELWHFYTWYKFGLQIKHDINGEEYNHAKEALTVLLNAECSDLMENQIDDGYPQHKEIREMILTIWQNTKSIDIVWKSIFSEHDVANHSDIHHPR